jgi:hypothetical protein
MPPVLARNVAQTGMTTSRSEAGSLDRKVPWYAELRPGSVDRNTTRRGIDERMPWKAPG